MIGFENLELSELAFVDGTLRIPAGKVCPSSELLFALWDVFNDWIMGLRPGLHVLPTYLASAVGSFRGDS